MFKAPTPIIGDLIYFTTEVMFKFMKDLREALKLAERLRDIDKYNLHLKFKPYPKQQAFLDSNSKIKVFLAGNRVGKTWTASYEVTCHLTGVYPSGWKGIRFDRPVNIWVVGVSGVRVRDTIQEKLFGRIGQLGTGMIPKDVIHEDNILKKSGIPSAFDTVSIKHISGERSSVQFYSYDQNRDKFQGSSVDLVWFDEEPPLEIYNECKMRVLDCSGYILFTFTPLSGITELYDKLLTDPKIDKHTMTMDDAVHLNEDAINELLDGMSDSDKKARREGIATIGSGKVFQFEESDYVCEPFDIPRHWRRVGGLDVGVNHPTAAVAMAVDDEAGCLYFYREYSKTGGDPVSHAAVLKKWGIEFAADPSTWNRSIATVESPAKIYIDEGLRIFKANNNIEASIHKIRSLIGQGKFWVFSNLTNLIREFRMYRDKGGENGKLNIYKLNDDMIDACRYCTLAADKATVNGMRIESPIITETWKPVSPYGY